MNRCGYERSSTAAAIGAEETVICPKPRRFGALNPSIHGFRLLPPSPPLRRYQFDVVDDSRAGAELFDLILSKGGYNLPQSPPFYSGSPPSRATNPVIEDAEFGTQNKLGFSPLPPAAAAATTSSSPLSPTRGWKPAVVRIEGFDCRQNCRISAVA